MIGAGLRQPAAAFAPAPEALDVGLLLEKALPWFAGPLTSMRDR
ncbi:hypothetical protein [Variovorax sp. JS1663]|nr:hypothetical protein [Variovorax sp. JS1663]